MKLPILLLFFSFFTACTEKIIEIHETEEKVKCISQSDRERLANFIVKCAEAANPKSDEEGEDLVKQCQWTGTEVLCPSNKLCRTNKEHRGFSGYTERGEWVPCK